MRMVDIADAMPLALMQSARVKDFTHGNSITVKGLWIVLSIRLCVVLPSVSYGDLSRIYSVPRRENRKSVY